jgi:hypothetical protein
MRHALDAVWMNMMHVASLGGGRYVCANSLAMTQAWSTRECVPGVEHPAFLLVGTEQTRTKLEKLLQVFTGQRDYNTWRF